MGIEDRIPDLSDKDLATLLANARRLAESEQGRRKEAAVALVPLIEAELDDRRARAPVRPAPVRKAPARKTPVRKPRAKARPVES